MLAQAALAGGRFDALAPRTVADEEEFRLGTARHQFGRDRQQVGVALELEQAGDFTEHKAAWTKAEPQAQIRIVPGGQKWFERKAAENARVKRGPADSGSEVCVAHGPRDADAVQRE